MNRRRNIIFSTLVLFILAISGFFIVNQLGNQQSASDAAAGSTCCEGGTCSDGRGFGSDTNGSAFANCSDRAAQFCGETGAVLSSGGGSTGCTNNNTNTNTTTTTTTNTNTGPGNTCSGPGNATSCHNIGETPGNICRCTRIVAGSSACGCVPFDGTTCSPNSSTGNCSSLGGSCQIGNNSGTCVNNGADSGGVKCRCDISSTNTPENPVDTGSAGQAPTTTTPTNNTTTTTNSGSAGAGAACTPGAGQCGNGYACTVVSANDNRTVCNPVDASKAACTGGGTCDRILAFRCDSTSDFAADGSCYQIRAEVDSFADGLTHINGCGQVDTVCSNADQLCGDFTIQRTNCGGSAPTGGAAPTVTVSRTCGSTCTATSQCPNSHTCSGGTCTKNVCLNNTCGPDAKCGTPLSCGSSCNVNGDCNQDHVCDGGTCKIQFCVDNPGSCTDGSCTPATCGNGTVDAGEACEIGEEDTCGTGTVCNTSTCQCDSTGCGDTCSADTDCPTDHSCGGNGTCELDFCADNPGECASDSCEVLPIESELPQTAIFSSTTDTIIFGTLIIMIAIVSYKVGIWNQFSELLIDRAGMNKSKNTKTSYQKRLIK
ncbi:hypothetical protein N9C96_02705 [bacterium]|nr:hypothetical protein [bacterium]